MTNRLATNATQHIVWRWEGEAFGNTPAQELIGISVNLRFPGQYFDEETNLHYNHFRYYDPTLGRYITSDPIGLTGGMNTYLYAGANPVIFIDPTGLAYSPNEGGKSSVYVPSICGTARSESVIPDVVSGRDISPACTAHDKCYDTCGSLRKDCDDAFLTNGNKICAGSTLCKLLIAFYHKKIVEHGQKAYDKAQKQACCN
ncbi:MAG: hypothetical protein HFP77_00275 [Methylococcales symbiont of Iophon sp. n. MRB-2018]|nr:MAG: hypothetical protein HFP77_00275 [Methylococcales symbiont of Iophon sp. n. MRB-2018]SMN11349.1 Rhs-family protein [uncultured Candidatus Thioglobus sp.]